MPTVKKENPLPKSIGECAPGGRVDKVRHAWRTYQQVITDMKAGNTDPETHASG
jgi:hypothetical protein